MPKRSVKRGRRPGIATTRDTIRTHAARAFAGSAYHAVSVRDIARAAGVDPALVHHYFGSKRALFDATLGLKDLADLAPLAPISARERASNPARTAGERIVFDFVTLWDAPTERTTLAALMRSAGAESHARTILVELIARTIVAPTAAGIDSRRGMPKLRAALVAAQLVGIAWMRYLIETEPLASASPRIVARTFGPSLDATLHGIDYGVE